MKYNLCHYTLLMFRVSICLMIVGSTSAQFIDNYDDTYMNYDTSAFNGWSYHTGDGKAEMSFNQHNGYSSIYVDATKDKQNIWWAFIIRRVSENMDLNLLSQTNYELRIEARIRTSDAPRRVNLHLNTPRTTDYHSHLMECDIPDTSNWHTISMTTRNFDIQSGDEIFGQLALMDWGVERYRVDVDYFKVDVVNIDSIGPDLGSPQLYRPPFPEVNTFEHHVPVLMDAAIDMKYSDENLNRWHVNNGDGKIILIPVNG